VPSSWLRPRPAMACAPASGSGLPHPQASDVYWRPIGVPGIVHADCALSGSRSSASMTRYQIRGR
jgi:hypothetical protein